MRPEKSKRVDTNPAQSGLAGLGDAFAGLNLGPLPSGPSQPVAPPGKVRRPGRVVLRKETAHRGGKAVIVVDDFPSEMTGDDIESLAKDLRKSLGTGGTVRERTIEMQGDHADKIRAFLENQGWRVAGV